MLTETERQERNKRIVELTLADWSSRQIAMELNISSNTVSKIRKQYNAYGDPFKHFREQKQKRDEKIVELTKLGRPTKEIAKQLNCSERTVSRTRKDNDCMVAPAAVPYTESEIELATKHLEDGIPYAEVARTMGRSVTTLYKKLPGYAKCNKADSGRIGQLARQMNKLEGL